MAVSKQQNSCVIKMSKRLRKLAAGESVVGDLRKDRMLNGECSAFKVAEQRLRADSGPFLPNGHLALFFVIKEVTAAVPLQTASWYLQVYGC